jgi:hypothetical protein
VLLLVLYRQTDTLDTMVELILRVILLMLVVLFQFFMMVSVPVRRSSALEEVNTEW